MSAPVDVLAVLDAQARHTRQFGGSPSFQTIEQARAAIAELIGADKAYDAADCAWSGERYERADYGVHGSEFWICMDCGNESGAGILNKGVTHEQGCRVSALERAIERRAAALRTITGVVGNE